MPQPQTDAEREAEHKAEQKSQVDAMLATMRRGVDVPDPVPKETPPVEEEVVKDEAVEEVETTPDEEDVVDEDKPPVEETTEEDEEEAPPVEEEPAPDEDEEPTEEEEGDWRQQLNKMAEDQLIDVSPEEPATEPVEEPAPEPKPVEKPLPAEFTISEDEYSSAMTEKKGLDNILQKSFDYQERRLQEVARALPPVINEIVTEIVGHKLASSDFLRMNEDLLPFKPLVKLTANKMFAKHPDMDPDELYTKVGEEVRKALKMKKGSKQAPVKKKEEPAFVKKSGSRKPQAPKLTGVKGEIVTMLNATNR